MIFTGDILFVEAHPVLWEGPGGNWIAAYEKILSLDVETVRDDLIYIRDEGRKRYDAALRSFEAAKDVKRGDHESWGDGERIAVNAAPLYREFSGPDERLDAATLFSQMAALYNERM